MNGKLLSLGGSLALVASLTAAGAPEASRDVKGTWSLNNWIPGSSVHLTLKHRSGSSRWQWGTDQPLSDLRGLTKDQLHAASSPVKFTLARDAGTFSFEGSVMMGLGTGEFGFTPDPTFAAKLQALELRTVPDQDLFGMAIRDISIAYASEVMRSGIKGASVRDLSRFLDHGVELSFIRELTSIGTTNLSPDDVIKLRDHGVEADLLRALKAAGYGDLASSDIVKLRDHGVDAAYIEGLQDSGSERLHADEIVRLRDHGIDPDFVKGLLSVRQGLSGVDDIIKLREHGVDAEYVARIETAGFTGLSVDQIIRLREHGID
jgi:hypothetical protein